MLAAVPFRWALVVIGIGMAGLLVAEDKAPPIKERLNTKIKVEFKREPLHSAFAEIGKQAAFDTKINGDALKSEGYTQNMPQSFKLEGSAGQALQNILKQYEKMCIVVDEPGNVVILTTLKAAAAAGQTPHKF